MGKGTYYKENSDLDCVVIAKFRSLKEDEKTGQYRRRVLKKKINRLTKDLEEESFIESAKKQNNLHLKVVVINDNGETVDVDILPTADHLTKGILNSVFICVELKLRKSCSKTVVQ